MNCCDYDCHQGRDCPARASCKHCRGIGYDASGHPCTCTMPAGVAKVGQRMQGPEPLHASPWRRRLHSLAELMLIVIIAVLLSSAIMLAVTYA